MEAKAAGPDARMMGGRFRILRHLGAGGMSEVYLAEQLSLGRKVALKVLRKEGGRTEAMRERFRQEAQLLSSVDHPAVVRVIDFEQSTSATCLVMELAEGETLESLLKRGPLAPARALTLLHQLAEGLAAIHDRGIVHRDLKPQNVVVSPGPRGEQARILDFGIAHLVEEPNEVSPPGMVVGTPAYLSPEQARGGALDTSTDVYSFGVMAFRMLSGSFPLPGPGPRDFLRQHLDTAPLELGQVAPGLRDCPELCALVMRCLTKLPAQRPPHGRALVSALSALPWPTHLAGNPPAPYAPPTPLSQKTLRMGVAEPQTAPGFRPGLRLPNKRVGVLGVRLRRRLRKAAGVLAQAPSRISPRARKLCLIGLGVAGLLPLAYQLVPPSGVRQVRLLLERGRPEQALPLVEKALEAGSDDEAALKALRAVALHQLSRHADEARVLAGAQAPLLDAGGELLLTALAEDFARDEQSLPVREALGQARIEALHAVFGELARGVPSVRQWGALRYLDAALGSQVVDRAALYARSLESLDCGVRALAAWRLAELGDAEAIPALRKLSETPKDEWRAGGGSCGQDEAAEAIRALNKHAALGVR